MSSDNSHESFGMISVSRVQGDATLVGSQVSHQHYISLKINTMEIGDSHGHVHYYPRQPIIEVQMSFAQWATLLSHMNTIGVPCTVAGRQVGEWHRCTRIDVPTRLERMKRHIRERARQLFTSVETLHTTSKELAAAPSITKTKVREIADIAGKVQQEVISNFPYYVECMQDATDMMVTEAKQEIDSFVTQEYIAAGLKVARNDNLIKQG